MDATSEPRARSWWREPQLWLLVLIVVAIYFPRLTALTIRGEESRRARVAVEILESGDWIVPTQQKQIYLSRPPLGSYPIALLGLLRGKVDLVAVRLPTVTAVLLTCVLIYTYSRTFLSAAGALASGLAFATMMQVMEIGRLAETEATFTLLVASSLLLWHWGYSCSWPAWLTWSAGYGFCALAGLAKGPQGPVYFVAVTLVHLLVRRDWKMLFSWSHVAGLATFALVLGLWQVPYLLRTDLESAIGIWTKNAAQRFEESGKPSTLLSHLFVYPLEVFACMLPWSMLLLRYADRRLLATLGNARSHAIFLFTAIAVTFPSVWFASTAKGRYYMPLYPCFAVLVGIVADRCFAADATSHLAIVWRRFSRLIVSALALSAIVVAVGSWFSISALERVAQPAGFAAVLVVVATVGMCVAWQQRFSPVSSLVMTAMMLGVTSTGVVLNAYVKKAHDSSIEIARLKQELDGAPLASFGRVDHLFAYHYEAPIAFHPIPASANEVSADVKFFAIDGGPGPVPSMPFAWEPVATIVLDRNKMPKPARKVIIGRRIDDVAQGSIDRTTK